MKRKIPLYILISVSIVFLILLAVFVSTNCSSEKSEAVKGSELPETVKQEQESQTKDIKVFAYTESSFYMEPRKEMIPASEDISKEINLFLGLLLQRKDGYINPFPEKLKIRTFFYNRSSGTLIIDFNDSLVRDFPGGTSCEIEFIYYIVNNICYNFTEIKCIKFLSSGNEYKTISGHIDLSFPLRPDYSLMNISKEQ